MKFKMVYTGIRVKDMDESVRFYTGILGMKLVGRARGRATRGEWAQLRSEGSQQLLELNWYSPESPFYTPWRRGVELDHLCFAVDDLDRALKELEARGIKRSGGPYFTGGWKIVDVGDPNGICIELGARIPRSATRRTRKS
ncbi:MAG: VOC family protein [Thermoplasmata archaeon]|nr:VOC family protein [Thermoplasmata archaeon]